MYSQVHFVIFFLKRTPPNYLNIYFTDFRASSITLELWEWISSSATILRGGIPVFNDWDKETKRKGSFDQRNTPPQILISYTQVSSCLHRALYFPSVLKGRIQTSEYISIPSWQLKTGTLHSGLVWTDYRAGFFVFGGGQESLHQGSGYSRQVPPTPKQTPFCQIRQRSASLPVKTGLVINPALVGFG